MAKEYPKVSFNKAKIKTQVVFASVGTSARVLKSKALPAIEFELEGERQDTVEELKRRIAQYLEAEFKEATSGFTIQKICVNDSVEMPQAMKLGVLNRKNPIVAVLVPTDQV